ncbi:hypothetical protein [Williamsia sp. M5A3_1d]
MSYGGQLVDLDEPKFVIDGMMSEQEAKKTQERILRAHRANLADGKPYGRVPCGYKIVRDPETGKSIGRTPDPDRVPLVLEAARRVLAGQSFGSVVRWIETKDPIGWDSAKLRRIRLKRDLRRVSHRQRHHRRQTRPSGNPRQGHMGADSPRRATP